jgi:uncharacterized protein YndB with AHSA1/START domain
MTMTHTLDVATPTDLTIVLTRDFDAPRELVFSAHTDSRHLPHWMLGPEGWTMPICEIDLRPGGAWRCIWRGEDGTEMAITGVYLEVDPPARVVHTETWGGDWAETQNTLEFVEVDGRTTLTSTMLFPTREARDAALGTGMNDGVAVGFARLDAYLSSLLN